MTIDTIRRELADCLDSFPGLRATPYITEEVVPPHAMFDYEIDPNYVFGGATHTYTFTVTVFCSRTAEVASQKFLDRLRDPNEGLRATVEGWDDLNDGTVAHFAKVTSISRIDPKVVGQGEYLTVDIEIEVVA